MRASEMNVHWKIINAWEQKALRKNVIKLPKMMKNEKGKADRSLTYAFYIIQQTRVDKQSV